MHSAFSALSAIRHACLMNNPALLIVCYFLYLFFSTSTNAMYNHTSFCRQTKQEKDRSERSSKGKFIIEKEGVMPHLACFVGAEHDGLRVVPCASWRSVINCYSPPPTPPTPVRPAHSVKFRVQPLVIRHYDLGCTLLTMPQSHPLTLAFAACMLFYF